MHDLAAIAPLGGIQPKVDTIGSIRIAEVTGVAIASVATRTGKETLFQAAANKHFGAALPLPGTWVAGKDYVLIWTGPDQWFAEAPFATHEDIARIVKAGLGDTASVTEQTDAWARFDVEGTNVVNMLERLCPAPVRRMETSDATRTIIEHIGCIIVCRTTGPSFSVICPRSYAASLHHALFAAARSVS